MARTIAKDHQAKRDALLKKAAVFFAGNGFDRASMNDLAAAAGVSKALLYHYFVSKEAILFAIIDAHLNAIVEAVEAADISANTPQEQLRALIQSILRAYDGADAEHRLQLEAMGSLGAEQRAHLAKLQRRLVSEMSAHLAAVVPGGGFAKPEVARAVTMSVFGILNWMYLWFSADRGISREEYGDLVTDMVLGGIGNVGN